MNYPAIAKEQIPLQSFRHDEVLEGNAAKKKRQDQLLKAVDQNRLFYTKARIVFDTTDQTEEVKANIWEVTDNHVVLNGGISMPVCCIREVYLEGESDF